MGNPFNTINLRKSKRGRPQVKHVSTETVFAGIRAVRRNDPDPDYRWASLWTLADHLQIHESLLLAKLRRLISRGEIGGCTCGCRGDFYIKAEHL